MKTKKIAASVMTAALCLSSAIPYATAAEAVNSPVTVVSGKSDSSASMAYTLGDVDGDAQITAKDATAVLTEYTKTSVGQAASFTDRVRKSADIDRNGRIDGIDASTILAFYAYSSVGGALDLPGYLEQIRNGTQAATTTTTSATTTTKTSTTTSAAPTTTTTTAATTTTSATTAAHDKINKISLTKTTMDLNVGQKDISYVTMEPASVADKSEKWESSDIKVAIVDGWGNVTAVGPGVCTVTVTSVNNPAIKAAIKVTVKDPKTVQEIKLTKTAMNLTIGQKDISYVTMLPTTATNVDEIWTTSDAKVATVDAWGNVTAVGAGTCTVTVTSKQNQSVKADIKVTVSAANDGKTVQEIKLSKTAMNLTIGQKDISWVTMLPATATNVDEIWTTSDAKVATVDAWGNVTAVGAGTCTVTVTSKQNQSVKADIKVTVGAANDGKTVQEIKLSKTAMNLSVGQKDISWVTMLPATATNVEEIWTTSDAKVATVDAWGNVTAVGAGTCTVTVTSKQNQSVKADIKVTVSTANDGKTVQEIKLSKTAMNLSVGQKDISWVTMLPSTATNVEEIWTTSDAKVATVDAWGNVTAVGAGTCTVTVTSKQNQSVKADIKVTVSAANDGKTVQEIKLSKTAMNLSVGQKDISWVTMLPTTATNVEEIWTTSDPKVATVDAWGNVTAVGAGTCTVTVTSKQNQSVKADIKVTVSAANDGKTVQKINLTKYAMNLNVGQKDISYVTMLPTTATNVEEIWTTSDPKVATVDAWGNVTAVGAGTCTVTVTSKQNQSVKADIKVTVSAANDGKTVQEIKLSKTAMNLSVGQKDISWVTMLPTTATNVEEIWTTSDPKVATVDAWGNVTAVGAGTCTVTVTSKQNQSVKADIKVTVSAANDGKTVQKINLTKYAMNLNVGQKDISYVTMLPTTATNVEEIWTTSDAKVATVDAWGNVTAVGAGTCTVTVTSKQNQSVKADIKVTVSAANDGKTVQEIKLSKTAMNLSVGQKDISWVTMLPTTATNVDEIWTTSDAKVATVDAWGNVTAVGAGTCTVTVTSKQNQSVKADIKVTVSAANDGKTVQEIKLSKTAMNLSVGQKDISWVTMLPSTATNVEEIWTTSDAKVATVDAWGNVTAVGVGTCTVTVTSKQNQSVKADIKVTVSAANDGKTVQKINLTKYAMNLNVGQKDISYVTMLPSTATNVEEIWTTSDPKVATVDAWGNVTAVGAGTCTVTVTSKQNQSVKADIKVTVSAANDGKTVQKINLTKYAMNLNVGQKDISYVTMLPTTATNVEEIWTTSDPKVATVDAWGNVTAVGAGTCTVTVTSKQNQSVKADIKVTVSAANDGKTVQEIKLSKTAMNLSVGQKDISWVTMLPTTATNVEEIWTTSDPKVATVDAWGNVTAVGAGTCTVTVTSKQNQSVKADIKVTVSAANDGKTVQEIKLSKTAMNLSVGQKDISWVTMLPTTATNVEEIWTTSDPKVATVDAWGNVTAVGAGTCTVTVTSKQNQSVKADIKVTVGAANDGKTVQEIKLSKTAMNLSVGQKDISWVTMLPATATNVDEIWTTSDPKVATVDAWGNVTAVGAGTCTVTVTSKQNQSVKADIKVTVSAANDGKTVQKINLTKYAMNLNVGQKDISYVTMLPTTATNVEEIWTTSDAKVATVDAWGNVTAVGAGTCTVTVTSKQNQSVKADIKVTVSAANDGKTVQKINLTKYAMNLSVGQKDISWVTMLPTTATNVEEIWTTSDPKVATVDAWGNVTAVGAGTCTVTVTSKQNQSVKADIKVTVSAANDGKTVQEIKLSKTAMNLSVGQKDISWVTMLPTTATNVEEIWTTSDPKVATVDAWGNVTAVGAGTCTVTVTSKQNQSVKADIKVTVSAANDGKTVQKINLTKYAMNLNVGQKDISYVTMLPTTATNVEEIWTTSDAKVATVDAWGNVTAVGAGTCTVTVTSKQNQSVKADIKVTVSAANDGKTVQEIKLSKTAMNLSVGQKDISWVTMLPTTATNVDEIWTTSDAKVATVDAWGNVTAVGAGTCTVTVTSKQNQSVKADIKVTVSAANDGKTVQEIKLSKTAMNLSVGQKDISWVTMLPSTATNVEEIWTTSDAKVATVDAWGNVTAVGVGTCTVTVTSKQNQSVKADIKVTVSAANDGKTVQKINLTKYAMNLNVGQKDISYVTMLPSTATNVEEIWTTSDAKVATVDAWGNVTAVGAGTCTVTVTSKQNQSVKADIKVTVSAANDGKTVQEIKLSKTAMNLSVGQKDISWVTMLPTTATNVEEIWTTSDPKVATVDAWGNVTAVGAGTCTVTVTSKQNQSVKADIKVTVSAANDGKTVQKINLTKYAMNLNVGQKDISYVTMLPTTATNVEEIWTTSDPKVATVDAWGNVTAVGAGTCTVTVTSKQNQSVKADIKVTVSAANDGKTVQEIKLSKTAMNLSVGQKDISWVTMLPTTATNVEEIWTTSDPKVATVDAWGNVTAVGAGTCTVTVTSKQNQSVKADIKVTVSAANDGKTVQEIKLSKTAMNLSVGQKDISWVTMLPTTATNVEEIWTTSDPKVATVDAWGNVTAVGAGTCTVTVTSKQNQSVKADIKVTVGAANDGKTVQEIKLSKTAMNLSVGQKDISWVTMLPATATNVDEIWTTSDPKVATVDAWGNVTAVGAGTCTVTVTSKQNQSVKADIKVTVSAANDGKTVQKINLTKYAMNLNVGQKDISYVTMLPTTATNVEEIWTTSDAKVATVDAWGNVTAVGAGTCTVTVTSKQNQSVKADITVTVIGATTTTTRPVTTTTTVTSTTTTTTASAPASTTSAAATTTPAATASTTAASTNTTAPVTTAPITETTVSTTISNISKTNFTIRTIRGVTYVGGIIVVNKTYSVPESFNSAGGLNLTAKAQFDRLAADAKSQGLNIYISSGYRSYATQSSIYQDNVTRYGEAMADSFSARPGYSEHQTGLAIDVNTIDDSFAGTPEARWLADHAHEYGFIIRYPEGKENITGYQYEPWHIRYLGIDTATAVYNSGLTLEEYLGIDSYYH